MTAELIQKPVIVILIPRGESIRNFIYTGITDELRQKFTLVFYAIVPNKNIEDMLRSKCDTFYEMPAKPKLSYKSKLLIDQTDLAHNRYIWTGASKLRWELREAEAKGKRTKISTDVNGNIIEKKYEGGIKARVYIGIKKAIATLTANPVSLNWLDNLLYKLSKQEPEIIKYEKELKALNPVLVFNTSHVHALNSYPIMQSARHLGIKTVAFLFSWDNLTSQGRIFPKSDYYLAWNEKIKNQLQEIYPDIKPAQVYVTGTPQFIFHFRPEYYVDRGLFLNSIGLSASHKYVLYSVGLSHNIPFEHVVAERIADMLQSIDPNLRLVIRTYAKDPTTVFAELAQRRPDIIVPEVSWVANFKTPTIEDQKMFTNLLLHCALGINVGSTVSLELAMFDKPVIYVGYDPQGKDISPISYKKILNYDHLKPIVKSGAFAYANNEDEMKNWIEKYYNHPELQRAERRKLLEDFFEINEEEQNKIRSAKYIVDAIENIVSAN